MIFFIMINDIVNMMFFAKLILYVYVSCLYSPEIGCIDEV